MYLEEKVDMLMSEQKRLIGLVELFLPNLEVEKGVIHFLEITRNTFNTYIKDDVIAEGKHYYKEGNKLIFFPTEVIKLKKSGIKGKKKKSKKQVAKELEKSELSAVNEKLGIINPCRSAG